MTKTKKQTKTETATETKVSVVTSKQQTALDKLIHANGTPHISARIRYLDSEGFTRSVIAAFLGKRYQHVRNVLITPLMKDVKAA